MTEKTSHKQILKSTGIVGGSQIITIATGIVRTKIIAVLLGPVGVGVLGIYQSTIEIIRSATGLGLGFSAVRDVAEAAGTNDQTRITRTIKVLRIWVWFAGLLGMLITIIFAKSLSRYGFGDESYARGIAILSVTLFTASLSAGQLALLQGLRQIGKMAKAIIWGGILGLLFSLPLYLWLGLKAIVPALVLTSLFSLLVSWWYSRRIVTPEIHLSLREIFNEGSGMVKLGFFTVISGLAGTGTMYLVRIFISKNSGIDAVGQFQAAWTLSAVYLVAVLRAMGSDYFPRLSAVNRDNKEVNRLVNEQTEVALLIASPLIVGMLSFMGLVVSMFYSAKFQAAVPILSWQIAGSFLKVVSWPVGFIILAKGKGGYFIFSELTFNICYFLLIFFGWRYYGIEITGISYLAGYFIITFVVFIIARILSGFKWSPKNILFMLIFGALCTVSLLSSMFISSNMKYITGTILTLIAVGISLSELRKIISIKQVIEKFRR